MVVRERRPDAAAGSLVPALKDRQDRVQAEFADRPYDELIRLIRTGPPKFSPFTIKQVDEGRTSSSSTCTRRTCGGPSPLVGP